MAMSRAELLALLQKEFREPEFNCGVHPEGYAWVVREDDGRQVTYALEDLDAPYTKAGIINDFWNRLGGRPDGV